MADKDKKDDVIESLLAEVREKVRKDIPLEDIEPEVRMEPEVMTLGEDFGPNAIEKAEEEAEEERDRLIREELAKQAQEEEARKAAEKDKERADKDARKKENKKVANEALEKVVARNKVLRKLKKKTGYPTMLEKLGVFATGSIPGLLLGTFDRMKEYESAEKALDRELGLAATAAKTAKAKLAILPVGERSLIAQGLEIIHRRTRNGTLQQGWQKGVLPEGMSLAQTIMGVHMLYDTVYFKRPLEGGEQTSEQNQQWERGRTNLQSLSKRLVDIDENLKETEKTLTDDRKLEVENLARDGKTIDQLAGWEKQSADQQRAFQAIYRNTQLDMADEADKEANTEMGALVAAKASQAVLLGLRGVGGLPKEFFNGVDKKHHARLRTKFRAGLVERLNLTASGKEKRLADADDELAKAEGQLAATRGKTIEDNPYASEEDKAVAANGKAAQYKQWNIGVTNQNLRDKGLQDQRAYSEQQNINAATQQSAEAQGGLAAYSPDLALKNNPFKDAGVNKEAWTKGFIESRTELKKGKTKEDYAKDNAGKAFDGQIKQAYKLAHFRNEIPPDELEALKHSTTPWQAHQNKLGELRALLFMQQEYNSLFAKASSKSAEAARKFGFTKYDPLTAPADATEAVLWYNSELLGNRIRKVWAEAGSLVRDDASEAAATSKGAPYKYFNYVDHAGLLKFRTWQLIAGRDKEMFPLSPEYQGKVPGATKGVPRILTEEEIASGVPVAPDGKTYLPDYWFDSANRGLAFEAMTRQVIGADGKPVLGADGKPKIVSLRGTYFQDPNDPNAGRNPAIPVDLKREELKPKPPAGPPQPPPPPGALVPAADEVGRTATTPPTHALLLVGAVKTKIPVGKIQTLPSGDRYVIMETGGKLRVVQLGKR